MSVSYVLEQVEAVGVTLRFNGEQIRVWYPETRDREDLAQQMVFLRAHRGQVAEVLRARAAIPAMPVGVRLVNWSLEPPPVAVESCGVVTDPALFARTTLEQLRIALANPGRWVGWSISQLIDRLAQVGVSVSLETHECSGLGRTDDDDGSKSSVG